MYCSCSHYEKQCGCCIEVYINVGFVNSFNDGYGKLGNGVSGGMSQSRGHEHRREVSGFSVGDPTCFQVHCKHSSDVTNELNI